MLRKRGKFNADENICRRKKSVDVAVLIYLCSVALLSLSTRSSFRLCILVSMKEGIFLSCTLTQRRR